MLAIFQVLKAENFYAEKTFCLDNPLIMLRTYQLESFSFSAIQFLGLLRDLDSEQNGNWNKSSFWGFGVVRNLRGVKRQKRGRTTTAPLGVQCSMFKKLSISFVFLRFAVSSGTLKK